MVVLFLKMYAFLLNPLQTFIVLYKGAVSEQQNFRKK